MLKEDRLIDLKDIIPKKKKKHNEQLMKNLMLLKSLQLRVDR